MDRLAAHPRSWFQTGPRSGATWVMLVCSVILGVGTLARAEEEPLGARIYKNQCASCHGESGQGTPEEYPQPLTGNRSVAQLARLIEKTMPQDDPGTCVGPDAQAVAAYIHDAFYSPLAQARNKPARIELSRLTVRQYRNAITDLVGSFRGDPGPGDDRQGLRGEYFRSRRFRSNDRLLDRIDPEIRFDFGTDGPNSDFEPDQFSIRWEGSVRAAETGSYEFVVRSENATRLWVNDLGRPLIDATVRSVGETEFRGSLFLLGGRSYSLRLEFSKAKQGVDDSDKQKEKPKVQASVALLWRPSGGVAEIIPARALTPARSAKVFAVEADFPPDDRSVGYERGTSVSKAWDNATTEAALEVSAYLVPRLEEFGISDKAPDRAEKIKAFARTFVTRAFRRPLGDDEARLYIDRQFEALADPDEALKRVILLVLKSPRFLYHELGGSGEVDGYDVAARLSFGLWDSIPDRRLLEAAASGKLADREEVVRQAERMVEDPRARSKVRAFLHQWLKVEHKPDLAKTPSLYPGFDEQVASDLRASLELFLDDVVWGEGSDFRRLLTADDLYLNGRLAAIYGADLPPEAGFQKVPGTGERAGLISHPYLMASFAYTATSSPIHRGVFLARSVLGRSLRPPPEAFSPLAPDLHPDLNTRERVALQTSPASCMNCHSMINPLGFALENFDAIGRFRDEEKGRPIDAAGSYLAPDGETIPFRGARELANYLSGSEEVHEAFVQQLFHYLVKQPIRAYGPDRLDDLRRSFAEANFSIRSLLVRIATDAALTPRSGLELVARKSDAP